MAIRNIAREPRKVDLLVTIHSRLDDVEKVYERPLEVPGGRAMSLRIPWRAREREYSHETRARVFLRGKLIDESSDFFSVSRNIWQVAIQAPGFIEWVPQAHELAEKVWDDRAAYTNVYEAFSWAPCSFSDLTPETDEWWSGQNNYHNSLAVLRRWMILAHTNGMKMITYSFAAAGGAWGLDFARGHPDWIASANVGLAINFTIRDLAWRKWARERGKPFLATVSRQWHSAAIDRGELGAIDFGAKEIIRSARMLGWDGVRFDSPWRWGALPAAKVIRQFKDLGIESRARELFADLYARQDKWTGDEVSYRNIKWAKYRIREALPSFAFSYNFGGPYERGGKRTPRAFAEACAHGGQIMNESLRDFSGEWKTYSQFIMHEADIVRGLGGHFVACGLSRKTLSELDRIYMKILVLSARAHPYLYTFQWGSSPAGTYSQFATRYGEYLWHPGWRGIKDASPIFDLSAERPVWWHWLAAWRPWKNRAQIVLHIITVPLTHRPYEAYKSLAPRQQNIRIAFHGFRDYRDIARVYAFTAEPRTRRVAVQLFRQGDSPTITLAEHHFWTLLVMEVSP